MRTMKDLDELEVILGKKERQELIQAIIDYFGEEDGRVVMNIVLYFKYPAKYFYLKKSLMKILKEL